MSPRSAEFFQMARSRLTAARRELDAGDPSASVSLAYYAMLYAARAALSERDLNAKTHGGTWSLFNQTFVAPGLIDADIGRKGQKTQSIREQADYEAEEFNHAEAEAVLSDAEAFVRAVARLTDFDVVRDVEGTPEDIEAGRQERQQRLGPIED